MRSSNLNQLPMANRRLLLLPVLLTAFTSVAQPEADDPNTPAAEPASEAVAETIPDTPLEDYEASEQISEDLSVSFPVDI